MNARLSFQEMLAHSNQRESQLYKWARVSAFHQDFSKDEFRFVHITYGEHHGMLVDEGEQADSAGTIAINDDFWRVPSMGWGSTVLKVGCSQEAADALESALADAGRDCRSDL